MKITVNEIIRPAYIVQDVTYEVPDGTKMECDRIAIINGIRWTLSELVRLNRGGVKEISRGPETLTEKL